MAAQAPSFNCYIYSRGVSSGGVVVGAAGFNEVAGPEVPIIWAPNSNTNGSQFGARGFPVAYAVFSSEGDGDRRFCDRHRLKAGKIISGMIGFGPDPTDPFNITRVLPYYWQATTPGNFTTAPHSIANSCG